MNEKNRLWWMVVPIMLSAVLNAQEYSGKTEIHGFLSQGYIKTTGNNYLVKSKNGSFEFNEAAITFSSLVHPKLRIGAQLFSRDFGSEGKNRVGLDWGYGDYQFKDALGLRFGKIKMPYGLHNQGRDVDILRTPILLPQSVYEEDMRDFTLAYQGGAAHGNLSLSKIGSLEYELFYGSISVPNTNSEFWRWVFSDFSDFMKIAMQLPPGTFSTLSSPEVTGRYTGGGSIKWNTPIQGLRLGVSDLVAYLEAGNKLDLVVPVIPDLSVINPFLQGISLQNMYHFDIEFDVDVKQYNSFSAEYNRDNLTLTGEYHYQDYRIDISGRDQFGISLKDTTLNWESDGYYGQASYRFSKWLEIGSYYSYCNMYPEDKKGLKLPVERGIPSYFAWQKDACMTMRFDLTKNWILKIEEHWIDGCAQVKLMNNPDGTQEHWNLFAVKTSYQF